MEKPDLLIFLGDAGEKVKAKGILKETTQTYVLFEEEHAFDEVMMVPWHRILKIKKRKRDIDG